MIAESKPHTKINRDVGKEVKYMKETTPDKNSFPTPGINSLFFEKAMWHVNVPQTKTMQWNIASSSNTAEKNAPHNLVHCVPILGLYILFFSINASIHKFLRLSLGQMFHINKCEALEGVIVSLEKHRGTGTYFQL